MDRVTDLKADYQRLGDLLLKENDGAKAAAVARERRMIGELLEQIEAPEVESRADELAARRRPLTEDPGAPSRRRRSGGG